jgi:hypothetical protein
VIVDPEPSGRPSPLRAARLAWSAAGRNATHHLVLQDDVELCSGFLDHVEEAIAARPDAALSLFTEWGNRTGAALRMASLLGDAWAEVVDPYVQTQALVLPAGVAAGFDAFAEREAGDDLMDDTVMVAYLRRLGVRAVVPVPNLVEHADTPSLVDNDRLGRRRSACFLSGSLPPPAWSGAITAPTLVPFLHSMTGKPLCDVRQSAGGHDWQRLGTAQILQFRGLGEEVTGGVDDVLSQVERGAEAVTAIGRERLAGLWLTALALGVSLAELWTGAHGSLDDALRRPVATAALGTMPAGAFRRSVDRAAVEREAASLVAIVRHGVSIGFVSAQAG